MKRFGRTVISGPAAREFAYEAKLVGSDHAPVYGDCQRPVTVQVTGLADKALFRLTDWKHNAGVDYAPGHGLVGGFRQPNVRHVDLAVRCRTCPSCLRARARLWRNRAKAECAASQRTWFGTLTLSVEEHFRCLLEAEQAYFVANGAALPADMIFRKRSQAVYERWRKYTRRLAKDRTGLRYVLTFEKHTSGLPHMHCLIHETKGTITQRQLEARWPHGFTRWKLDI